MAKKQRRQGRKSEKDARRAAKRAELRRQLEAMPPAQREEWLQARRAEHAGRMRQRRRRLRMISALFVGLLVLGGAIFSVNTLLKVKNYRLLDENGKKTDGVAGYTAQQIIDAVGVSQGAGMFSFSLTDHAEKAAVLLPELESLTVTRGMPDTLVIKAVPARERYTAWTPQGWAVISDGLKVMRLEEDYPTGCAEIKGLDNLQAQVGHLMQIPQEDTERNEILPRMLAQLAANDLLEGMTELQLTDTTNMSMVFENRVRVTIGSMNQLDYKLQLAGYILGNQNGDGISENESGVLDCSHITTAGTISPVFAPGGTAEVNKDAYYAQLEEAARQEQEEPEDNQDDSNKPA